MLGIEIVKGPVEGDTFTASTFLDYLRKSNDHWWREEPSASICPWVFRGHCDENWPLTPTAARENYEGANEFRALNLILKKRYLSEIEGLDSLSAEELSISLRGYAHLLSMNRFIMLARELTFLSNAPLELPDNIIEWSNSRINADRNIFLDLIDLLNIGKTKHEAVLTGDIYALAQHHGIATFLLDWTENPITAIYFAAKRPINIQSNSGIAVWALNISRKCRKVYNLVEPNRPTIQLIRPANSKNKFLSSQSGIFTFVSNLDYLSKLEQDKNNKNAGTNLRYPKFEDLEGVISKFDVTKMLEMHSMAPSSSLIRTDHKFETKNANYKKMYQEKSKISKEEALMLARKSWIEKDAGSAQQERQRILSSYPTDTVYLRKIVLSNDELPELRHLLFREGISMAHLMPTLDNVANTIKSELVNEMSTNQQFS